MDSERQSTPVDARLQQQKQEEDLQDQRQSSRLSGYEDEDEEEACFMLLTRLPYLADGSLLGLDPNILQRMQALNPCLAHLSLSSLSARGALPKLSLGEKEEEKNMKVLVFRSNLL